METKGVKMEEVTNTTETVEAKTVTAEVVDTAPSQEAVVPTQTRKQKKAMRKYSQYMKKMMAAHASEQERRQRKLMTEISKLKSALGKDDFEALKSICTIHQKEVIGPDGSVMQKASSTVNYQALLVEGRQALAINREQRILAGKRKRSTGRSSDRKAHKGLIDFLNKRAEKTLETETVK
jgi:hypothetical protein